MTVIIGIKLNDRNEIAPDFQRILTKFGCIIGTRLGLHSHADRKCTGYGVILLEINNNDNACKELETELCKIENIEIQKMVFG